MAIDRYLFNHFKGKYRTYPELTTDTNDFVRNIDGEIDDDYSDFYLKGRNGIKIMHGVGSELACYIPSSGLGYNVVRDYCKLMCGIVYKDYNKAADKLIASGFINEIDFLDGEVWFSFDVKYIDDLNKIVKIRTSGANISPLSTKNLKTTPYTIPINDREKYNEAKKGIEPLRLGRLNDKFGIETFGSNYRKLLRASRLKAIAFFHKNNVWTEYCDYLRKVER